MANFGLNYDLVTLQGYDALKRRLNAIQPGTAFGATFMRQLGMQANREQRQLLYRQVTRRTGFAGRTIDTIGAEAMSVQTVARSYAVYIDRGTRQHKVMPKTKKFLAWPLAAGGRRATGAARKGYKGGWGISWHGVTIPAMRPKPFMVPGGQRAVAQGGVADRIVAQWNEAA